MMYFHPVWCSICSKNKFQGSTFCTVELCGARGNMILEILFPRREISILTLVSNTPYTRSLLNVSCHNNFFLSLVKNVMTLFFNFPRDSSHSNHFLENFRVEFLHISLSWNSSTFWTWTVPLLIKRNLDLLYTANCNFWPFGPVSLSCSDSLP